MNKNILILSVLLALSPAAFADAGDKKPTAEPPQPAVATTTPPTVQKEKESAEKKETPSAIKVDGRDVVKDSDGKLAAYICETGMDCRKQVLVTKEITDLAAISAELKKISEEAKKVVKKEDTEKDKFDSKQYTRDLIADLEDTILDSCDIETKSSRRRDLDDDRDTERPSWSRVRSRTRSETSRASVLSSNRFTSLPSDELEDSSESTECAAEALQSKLEELEQGFGDDLAELGLEEEDLENLNEITKNLNREIRKEKDPTKKASLELALSKVKALTDKVKLTQNVTQRFVRSQVLNRFEDDLAARAGYGETYLHRMASSTPELFEGVRKDAAVSILEVYKKQVRAHIAARDAGNLQESNRLGNLAIGYNVFMTGRQADGKSAGQKLMEQYALDANLNPRSVVNDVYSVYSPAEAQIREYLTSTAAGGVQGKATPLPGVITANPMYSTEAGIPNVTSRGTQPGFQNNVRAKRGQQAVSPQQGRASVAAPNGPPRGGVNRGF